MTDASIRVEPVAGACEGSGGPRARVELARPPGHQDPGGDYQAKFPWSSSGEKGFQATSHK